MNQDLQLSLIFPCYNEEESLLPTLKEALDFQKSQKFQMEILLVDDGSNDRTIEFFKPFENQVRLIRHESNKGYGAAIKTGLFYSQGQHIAFLDFDGTCDAADCSHLLSHLKVTDSDLVLGNRLHDQSEMPKTRRIGNHLYRHLLRLLADREVVPDDICSGFRVLKRSCAEELFMNLPDDLSFTPAMTAMALKRGFKVSEIPITYRERFGSSKISLLKDGPKFAYSIFKGHFS
ncbi:glycosyltransferase family 2 protein [bacterium]|nr:glycosyltransferase family 2 protein [bacterium]